MKRLLVAHPAGRQPRPGGGDNHVRGVPAGPFRNPGATVTGRPARLLRAGLTVLALGAAVLGAWMYFAPRSFYDDWPTVSDSGPFSQHLMSDIGGLNLALAVVLGSAAVWLDRRLTRVALAAFLVYSISHLVFHLTDLMGLSAGGAALLITNLALLPAIAIALLVLTIRPGLAHPNTFSAPAIAPRPNLAARHDQDL